MGLLKNIKSEQKQKNVAPQDEMSLKIQRALDNICYAKRDVDKEIEFIEHVRTRGTGEEKRTGLHASELVNVGAGDYCVRRMVLQLMYEAESGRVPPKLKRIFEIGDQVHEMWQKWFINAGLAEPTDCDRTRWDKKRKISFSPDIICKIPNVLKGECVVEIKSANDGTYLDFLENGHKSAEKQLQIYMWLTGIHQGIVLVYNKNTSDFFVKYLEYDSEAIAHAENASDEIIYYYKRLKKEKKMVKRPKDATDADCKKCKKCGMRKSCWNLKGGRKKI